VSAVCGLSDDVTLQKEAQAELADRKTKKLERQQSITVPGPKKILSL
jgi:hypothetical protein